MNYVKAPDGRIVNRSRNLRGVLRYLSGRDYATRVDVDSRPAGAAELRIAFASGNTYRTDFASRAVLMGWLAVRRNLRGVALVSDGEPIGEIGAVRCDHAGEPIRTELHAAGGVTLFTDCRHCGHNLSRGERRP